MRRTSGRRKRKTQEVVEEREAEVILEREADVKEREERDIRGRTFGRLKRTEEGDVTSNHLVSEGERESVTYCLSTACTVSTLCIQSR